MFITFEGIEGSGKTTQIELLYRYLSEKGLSVIKTREPGGTIFGETLRNAFLHGNMKIFPLSELLLFMAMRSQHVEEVILPSLAKNKVVLCDRFADASYAYQGYGRGIDTGTIELLNGIATKGLCPALTILIKCPVEQGLKRKAESADMDRFEKEDLVFHRKIEDAYDRLAKDNPERFYVIDGTNDIDSIHKRIREKVKTLLDNNGI